MPELPTPPPSDVADRIARLETRMSRLEAYLELDPEGAAEAADGAHHAPSEDEIEYEVGQKWFARFGVFALAGGGGYMLSLPYPSLPPLAPSLTGLTAAAALFLVAHLGRHGFTLASSYLRAAAMALLYCATVRLSYFGVVPIFAPDGLGAHLALPAAALVNVAVAWRRRSPWLMALAMATMAATPVLLADPRSVLGGCVALAVGTAFVGSRRGWGGLLPYGALMIYAGYVLWAMGDPVVGNPYHWAAAPAAAPVVLLLTIAVMAAVPLWTAAPADDAPGAIAAFVHCLFGYGVFLVHTVATNPPAFAWQHVVAALTFLWLATELWRRCESQLDTFFYAMCAYAALTMAIVKLSTVPNVFVWLSVESVVVVATAVWFRSRFIVVTNFAIYVVVVLGYIVLNEHETGVSIGFGVVALVSARILNWQQHRLALKTTLMRNAYLVSAFVVFPYALYHLAAPRFAALSWVGLAALYYGLNAVVRNQKYRWMGHATLLLTTVYLLVPAHPGMTPALRIASFLAVGGALLVVSVVFTQAHRHAVK